MTAHATTVEQAARDRPVYRIKTYLPWLDAVLGGFAGQKTTRERTR